MNQFERLLDGFSILWRRSWRAVLALVCLGVLLVLVGCAIPSGLWVGMGFAVLILFCAFAWSIGDSDRLP